MHVYVCVRLGMYINVYVYMYVYIHTDTHTHMYTYTYILLVQLVSILGCNPFQPCQASEATIKAQPSLPISLLDFIYCIHDTIFSVVVLRLILVCPYIATIVLVAQMIQAYKFCLM